MVNRKLLEILSRLSAGEHKRLRLFLQSPYFSHGGSAGELLRLYDYIIQYGADENDLRLSKEVVFAQFFPHRAFQEKGKSPLDDLTSDLLLLVRRFLSQDRWEREEADYHNLLSTLKFYQKFGLEDRFEQTVQALQKMQKSTDVRDAQYFLRQFYLEEEIARFKTLSNTVEDDANLMAASQNMDAFYSIVKFELICALHFQSKVSQVDGKTDTGLINTIIAQNNLQEVPLIHLCGLVLELIKDPGQERVLAQFEQSLEKFERVLPLDRNHNFQAFHRFFLSRRYVKHGSDFARQRMFDVYKEHFEKGYFYIDGLITITGLRVLVIFALKLGKFDWVRAVLEAHPPDKICGTRFPAEVYSLNWGEYHFYKGEYERARDRIIVRPFENPHFSILGDLLLIKIYFETKDDLLDSRMKALDQKVRRTKISTEDKARYYNFLRKLDKIVKYAWQPRSDKRRKLAEDIRSVQNIVEREWLLEKAAGG